MTTMTTLFTRCVCCL